MPLDSCHHGREHKNEVMMLCHLPVCTIPVNTPFLLPSFIEPISVTLKWDASTECIQYIGVVSSFNL